MAQTLFGTDGIRGVAGEYPLDPKTVYAIGRALARRLGGGTSRQVLLGMDTRESGPEIAACLAGGLAEGGLRTVSAGVLPTAAVSLLTSARGFAAGAMISASHNPFEDNGIKVFAPSGFKLPDEEEAAVEAEIFALLGEPIDPRPAALEEDPALLETYFEHLLGAGAPAAELRPMRLAVDCSNGAASSIAARFFAQLGMQAEVFADTPNGRNINLDCGSTHLDPLKRRVLESGVELGVAFDGDADRALFVSGDGAEVDGDTILLLAGRYLKSKGLLDGDRVVATILSNGGLAKGLAEDGVTLVRTPVGDKNVLEKMVELGAALGGEQSGHIILRRYANTGDGLLTARLMIELLSAAGRPLSELRKQLTVFPQRQVNVRVARKPPIEDVPELRDAVAACKARMGDGARIVVRYSGTEPKARIMIEAEDAAAVERECEILRAVFERVLGAPSAG